MKKMINMLDLMKRVSNVAVKLSLGALIVGSSQIEALNMWEGGMSSDLSDPTNWSAGSVPGTTDSGYFSSSGNTAPTLGEFEDINVGNFVFTDSTLFTFNIGGGRSGISFNELGIQNQGSTSQIFNINDTSDLVFNNSSTSGNSTINLGSGGGGGWRFILLQY